MKATVDRGYWAKGEDKEDEDGEEEEDDKEKDEEDKDRDGDEGIEGFSNQPPPGGQLPRISKEGRMRGPGLL